MRTKSLGVNKALAAVLTLGELLAAPAAARRERAPVAGKLAAAKRAEIKGRLKEGLSALAARDLTTAAQKIADAYLEAPSPDGLYALAQLALAEGKTLQAQDLMKRYLADPLLEAAPDSAEYQEAERVVALPLPPSALLEIQGTRGTIIKLDGRPVGVLPLAGPVRATPGEHSIDILAGDGELHETVRLSSGRYSELRYNLAPRAFIINVLPGALLLIQAAGLAAPELLLLRAALEGAAQKERYSPLSLPADRAGACQTGESCALASARQLQAEYIVTARAEKN
ncbi:MAG TPA: hypothetical protein PLW65_17320, partial [Pseudomonadota bacterium]|nr:hypothetical protein [Pseudomonadota bacterium]